MIDERMSLRGLVEKTRNADPMREMIGFDAADIQVIPRGLVLVAAGVRPKAELAEAAGLLSTTALWWMRRSRLRARRSPRSATGRASRCPTDRVRLESVQATVQEPPSAGAEKVVPLPRDGRLAAGRPSTRRASTWPPGG